MTVGRKTGIALIGLIGAGCLAVLAGQQVLHPSMMDGQMEAGHAIPVFPGSSLVSKLPAQGEARYLSFGSYSEPEEIRRFFTEDQNLGDWKYTGQTAGSSGVVLRDGDGRRLIIDVRMATSCLLICQHQIHYWLAAK
jgi:hypothetical protein